MSLKHFLKIKYSKIILTEMLKGVPNTS